MCKGCHVVLVRARIKSLTALSRAVKRLGGQLNLNQRQYRWWGSWLDDYHKDDAAYKQGVAAADYGKCDHAIVFEGVNYEIGVVKQDDGFNLVFDFMDDQLIGRLGGNGAPKLLQSYAVEAAIEQAQQQCQVVTESVLADGSIQLRIQVQE